MRCAAGSTVREACAGLVDDLHERWDLPSVYLLIDGRLRCQASRGYFQVSDGVSPGTGVIGRTVATRSTIVIEDVTLDPTFIAAIPGLRAEACVPVWVHGEVVGAVNLESRTVLDPAAVLDAHDAATMLGARLEQLGGLSPASLAERLARIAVSLACLTDAAKVHEHAVLGALSVSSMSSAALAWLDQGTWVIAHAAGPLAPFLRSWDDAVLRILGGWVWAGTSSYFPDGEAIPPGYEFVGEDLRALSVQPLVVAGQVTGLLMTADAQACAHDPAMTAAMELLAAQTAATLGMVRTLTHLEEQATRDPLTGLVNRRRLLEELQSSLDGQRTSDGAALVLIDLDGFKSVNDQYGHAIGDTVLRAVAERLEASARPGDVVCRLGGDEFAVLVRGVGARENATVAASRYVAAITAPPTSGWHPPVGASAGVRMLRGSSASALLVDADIALYAAKRAGRGQVVPWDLALRRGEAEQDALIADLRVALQHGDLTLAYQPVVDIGTFRVRGIEALARWHHPLRGQVPPSAFIACAEHSGLIAELTRWVLRTAFQDASSWALSADGEDIKIAVNISAAQLGDDSIVRDVGQALAAAHLPADRVVLEVTETAEVVDLVCAKRTLQALAALGVSLALDDFGTGYSSLTHAHELPFDILKIDRSFVAAAAVGDRRALATIAAVCAFAGRIQVDIVAEGVEDQAQLPELTALGCNHAQGYALARPMSGARVAEALGRQEADGWVLDRATEPVPCLVVVPAARRREQPRKVGS